MLPLKKFLDGSLTHEFINGRYLLHLCPRPLLIYGLSTQLNIFPPLGWYGPSDWILPSLTLGLFYAAYIARLTRAGMLETLQLDYVRTARAKGASSWRILTKHASRGGLLPVITFLGPAFAGLISGSFVIESIFFIPDWANFLSPLPLIVIIQWF